MHMPITEIEKRVYEEKIHLLHELDVEEWASICFNDNHFRLIFIKAMTNLIKDTTLASTSNWSETLLLDDYDAAKEALEKILLEMVKVASGTRKVRSLKMKTPNPTNIKGYTTGQLATYFGVSTTTINNWINEGRFLKKSEDGNLDQVKRKTTNEKIRIHPDFWYDAPSGVRYQVKEAVESYHDDIREWQESKQSNTVNEKEQILSYLDHFKKKYEGEDFNAVFGNKDWNHLTTEEETDAAMWSFFLQRIADEEDSRD
ncbi:MerR family transcriptional regulator [Falsibacillus albus]|uniref:DNA-binding protein n=1 Tax=Falsibacillus albus TaxID=2478915 RepID=A0A3L7JNC6_9BACI|nr:helix-turn-helix domain-containing protein [Falsibacillus albus]RLQ92283.1 DNA-binding protein [Falsibacillus albus]